MPETRSYTVWKYEEAPEDLKEKILEKYWDINVCFDWWNFTYDDAETIGLKISEFDLDRGNYVKGSFIDGAEDCAHKIKENHGENCETYKTAAQYLQDRAALVKKYSDGKQTDVVAEDNEYYFENDCDDLDAEFLKSLCEDYRIILKHEYEYLTSKEEIEETLRVNDYSFTENGKID